jgi:hypothetical protein
VLILQTILRQDTAAPVRRPPAGRPAPAAEAAAALFAGVAAMTAYCLALAVHGTYPFGPRSRAVNDLGNQFVPFYAHLWDLIHGQTSGDLLFNWGSGYGVPFLADFFTYLMSPFSWLVALFPRGSVQAPVFLVTLLSIGFGAALMTGYLGRIGPGSPWPRALLSVGYALSAWTISDGFSDVMWMWCLVALPMLGIAYDWCLHRRRWAAGALLVTVSWAGDFYTAAMATLGMLLILLVRLLLDGRPAADRARAGLRALSMTVTGVLVAAPVLTVTYAASRATQPPPADSYAGPPAVQTYLAHLLPAGFTPAAPRIGAGLLALLLVLTLPFMRQVAARERIAWFSMLLAVALSYVWKPTILLWHGMALPNGSPYRAAVAMTAMLVVVAWRALSQRPSTGQLLAGAALAGLLCASAAGAPYLARRDWTVIVPTGAALVGLLVLYRRLGDRRARIAVVGALTCTVFLSVAYNVWSVTVSRDQTAFWQPKRTFDSQSLAAHRTLRAQDSWPAGRTDPGPHEFADNDPLLLGGEGGAYYSSYVPEKTASALRDLGAGWYWHGRHVLSLADPVGRAIMGVSGYLTAAPGTTQGFREHLVPAPPLVTRRSGTALDGAGGDSSVFALQERVLGATVYTQPALRYAGGPRPVAVRDGWHLPGNARGKAWTSLSGSCRPGDSLEAYTPWFAGTLRAGGGTAHQHGAQPMTRNGIVTLGSVPAAGRFDLALGTRLAQDVPRRPIACLDPHALARAVAALRASGPLRVSAGGHSLRAVFRPGAAGTAVVAVPAVDGWKCSVDGGRATSPGTLGGLIAVRLDPGATRLACSFHTPGLTNGLLGSALGLAVLAAVGIGGCRARGRSSQWY